MIDEFVTIDFKLIAIHSSLDDYRLAYFINRELEILLEKHDESIGVKARGGEGWLSRFSFEDSASDTLWTFIQNKNKAEILQKNDTGSLFGSTAYTATTNVYLLPEMKKVDYILKIDNPAVDPQQLVDRLLGIKHITTAYAVDHHKLKSKNNLIF
ncbi:hypothetical protein CHU92_05515 [Flavobacterium cyanobacteriorum]|uniref:IPExxxVDY family protein n=1 Tax=Flavobacterium cyanobacteriorum TaxID=2022802 RepID=A0A255ZBP2_9FLAO|nr:IPExxxVDY family protein [Flavobacterium cyanobacteriorum]OYQ38334.1 hypothetical protein CHU92_05515 [Flavobacterium cyanobacteriorum]